MINNLAYFSKLDKERNNEKPFSSTKLPPIENILDYHLFSNLPYLTSECGISCHENLIKIKCGKKESFPKEIPVRAKNDIRKFSMNSRRRLQKKLSMVNLSNYHAPLFVTTTFHNVYPQDSEELKKFFRNYIKRLKSKNKSFSFVWRIEWQDRGAPHFHIIFFLPKYLSIGKYNSFKTACRSMWARWLDDLSIHSWTYSVKIIPLEAKKKLYQYISKYTAKENQEKVTSFSGQRHGASENLDLSSKQEYGTSREFIRHFMKIVWEHIAPKFEAFDDFYKVFFADGEMSFLMSMEEQRTLFRKATDTFIPI